VPRLVIGCALLGLGGLLWVANWMIVVQCLRTRWHISLLPLFGGLFAFAGCASVPAIGWKLGLVALASDPGTLVVGAFLVHEAWRSVRG
jgi:hypothetical protein